ncbi:MAG: HDOD domain-containing protein, partial [Anaerolineae bacterium]
RLFIVEAENDKKPLYQVELDEVGFNHAQLGGHLLKVWRLPNSLVETVTYQHDPCNAPEFPELASTLHMADCMVYSMELGCSGQRGPLELVDGVLELLGLTPPAVDEIRQKTQDLYNTTLDTFLN